MNNTLHIAFLTSEYPHTNLSKSGGIGTSIKNLAIGLVKSGARVSIFVVGQINDLKIRDHNVEVIAIGKQKHIAFNWYFERIRTQRLIQRYIDSENVHLIEAPDWTGISAFMNFNIPIIIRLNGSDGYFCNLEGRKQKKKHFFLERKALNNADAIISVSDFTGKLTKQIFKIKSSIRTIHNSIDSNNFKPIGLKINQGQLLYFGTIIRKKGILDLAQIFNRVIEKKTKCIISINRKRYY